MKRLHLQGVVQADPHEYRSASMWPAQLAQIHGTFAAIHPSAMEAATMASLPPLLFQAARRAPFPSNSFLLHCHDFSVKLPNVEAVPEQDLSIESVSVPMSSPKVLRLRDYRHPEPDGVLLSLAEVCERLGVQAQVVYALKHHGFLHVVPEGRRLKYLSWEVEALEQDRGPLRAGKEGVSEFKRFVKTAA